MRARSATLLALSQAALALPGLATADGETLQTDYLYSRYEEASLPAARSASGSASPRFRIDTHLLRASLAVDDSNFGLDLNYETLSGASPWFILPDAEGRPVQVMSGASIQEQRTALQASWNRSLQTLLDGLDASATLGYSSEDDYRSLSGGAELGFSPEGRQLTYTAGFSYSSDTLQPTRGASSPTVIASAQKRSHSLYGGLAWVLGPETVVQASLSYLGNSGYLSDPYKLAYLTDTASTTADERPDGRVAWALTGRLRQFLPRANAALHLDYRWYRDDWKIESHTVDLAWYQTLPGDWQLVPSLRWYSQSQAYFYAPYYRRERADGFASSDYRLSPFGALSGRLAVSKRFGGWLLGAGVEHYQAKAGYALGEVELENPGLVQFTSLDLRVSWQF
ncbi:DUF3570 domain-containing protein [Stagnimonas aquatica]|uniref:DUF3570 domain-containing protein n=1 Tax=Stagnimonas aquatica TaxID=2689987 RepID=A0A3N0VEJ4_9GAMM|nr:DUF3570 domain-containing protein [Stagnimonas aquatica]ROH91084.1 DUF3570 domain-containing protein [Stagnimonas aquatica]